MITPQALMLGASILISLHSLNLAFIRRKLQLPITFILLELISIGISWIALTLPEHYLPFDTLQNYQKIIVIAISTCVLIISIMIGDKSADLHEEDDFTKFLTYFMIPIGIYLIVVVSTLSLHSAYNETLDTQTNTSVLYKTELDSDVTLTYHEHSIKKDKVIINPSSIATLAELQQLTKDYQSSYVRITVTAQGAVSEIKPQTALEIKLHTNSDEKSVSKLTTPEQIQVEVTQIRLSKTIRTERHWVDALLHTDKTIEGQPSYVLDIDYKITNLEQLQNAKEVQQKLDKLLENVQ